MVENRYFDAETVPLFARTVSSDKSGAAVESLSLSSQVLQIYCVIFDSIVVY